MCIYNSTSHVTWVCTVIEIVDDNQSRKKIANPSRQILVARL